MFRDLFRQLSNPLSSSSEDVPEVSGVFVIPGHVFVATASKIEKGGYSITLVWSIYDCSWSRAGQAKLYGFNCTLPLKDSRGCDDNTKSCLLELGGGCGRVVNVIKGSKTQQIYVVRLFNQWTSTIYLNQSRSTTFLGNHADDIPSRVAHRRGGSTRMRPGGGGAHQDPHFPPPPPPKLSQLMVH